MKRILRILIALPLLVLAACGGSYDHNDADVTFVQQMIPHHRQAIMMANLVPGAGASPDVTALAARIKAAQAPEITQMSGWLDDWDENGKSHGEMGGMDSGDGMMSGTDMRALGSASGAQFDRLWLTGMIAHHKGAVTMARKVLKDGKSSDVTALARNIVTSQTAEITIMKRLLG